MDLDCDLLYSLILSVTSLISLQSTDLATFLNSYFKANEVGLPSSMMTSTYMEKKLSLVIFTGLLLPCFYDFLFIILSLS